MSKQGVLLFVLSLAAGMVAGGVGGKEGTKSAVVRPPVLTSEAGSASPKWELRDFIAAARTPQKGDGLPLSHWSVEQLRAALDECMHGPEGRLHVVQANIFPQLLSAWMQRDPDAALAWFDGIDPPLLRRGVAGQFASLWPEAKADEGFAYFLGHRELFNPYSDTFQNLLIRARAKQGPEAVFAALQQFSAEDVPAYGNRLELPDGFDFPSLLERDLDSLVTDKERARVDGGYSKLFKDRLIQAWYAQDREQTFDWLVEKHGAAGLEAISTYTYPWKDDHYKWLKEKIAALASEQQDEFLSATREKWLYEMRDLQTFAKGTTDPALQEKLLALAVDGVAYGNIEPTLEVIATNPDLEQRLALLEECPIGPRPHKQRSSFINGDYLRKTLGEWGAEPGRIEGIIARFQEQEASLR
jgi:hypothetical protein